MWNILASRYYKVFMILVILYHMAIVFGEPTSYKKYDSVNYSTIKVDYKILNTRSIINLITGTLYIRIDLSWTLYCRYSIESNGQWLETLLKNSFTFHFYCYCYGTYFYIFLLYFIFFYVTF